MVWTVAAVAVVGAGWAYYDYVDSSKPEVPDFWAESQGSNGAIYQYVIDNRSCMVHWDQIDTRDPTRIKIVIQATCDRDEADAGAIEPDSIIAGGFWDRCIISGMQTDPVDGPQPPNLQIILDCTD